MYKSSAEVIEFKNKIYYKMLEREDLYDRKFEQLILKTMKNEILFLENNLRKFIYEIEFKNKVENLDRQFEGVEKPPLEEPNQEYEVRGGEKKFTIFSQKHNL